MPEGDTIHKLAEVLRGELARRELVECLIRGVYGSERLAGSKVREVEALGKHMLLHFDRELLLRVHLGMKGSWHRYPHGARWKMSKSLASVVLKTESAVLVCFNALDVELIPSPQRKWHRQLNNLGPDLLACQEPDWEELVKTAYRLHDSQYLLGEVLLDQRVAAGIGNVYKSELAFMGVLEGDPFQPADKGYCPYTPLGKVPPEVLKGLFERARHLLQANLGPWKRTTRVDRRTKPAPRGGNLYVYGRGEAKCYRCVGKIQVGYQGLQNRITYWCDLCQTK